ncbi:U-box domain-containing protein 21-like [Malania oleifera]|uniref:U-box domain-containing protein 21-like n=1 Tax=Malania oleifera TaxID=397392 RepID=UPI0025ADE5FB|nr:U-box domain-containing protein 21-like [Malania oleifera]
MISAWKKRRANRHAGKNKLKLSNNGDSNPELAIPAHFQCPISLDLMKDPVTLSTGITYDRESIEKWIEAGNRTCPVTNRVLTGFDQIPNHSIRKMIQDWCVENSSRGVERIPTPRIPVSPYDVSETCSKMAAATLRGDWEAAHEQVRKIKAWGKESERNRRCISDNGTGTALAGSFELTSSIESGAKHGELLVEIISVLPWMFPLGVEGQGRLGSAASLRCMVRLLKDGDLSVRRNTVLVLEGLLSSEEKHGEALLEIEGAVEALYKVIEEPISHTATKASLKAIFCMISSAAAGERITSRFVEMGLVSVILEMMFDAEKGACEQGLGVLDIVCSTREGMEKAYDHPLTVPVLVKKILRVSGLATEFSVSILWKLCKNETREDGGVFIEALQVGAFQKLLVVLQVGCVGRTKERVTGLLKMLNLHGGKLGCVDSSMGFKYLKRSY